MSQTGIGAMLHMLGGGSEHNPDEFYGRKITEASCSDECLRISFDDGVTIQISDEGQSCCESRYITCDDDPTDLVGCTLRAIETRPVHDIEGEHGDVHEQIFIDIKTDKASINLCTHNEHNGYYGGFGLTIKRVVE